MGGRLARVEAATQADVEDKPEREVSSFTKSLFLGEIHEELVFPWPAPDPGEQERIRELNAAARDIGSRMDHREIEEKRWIGDDVIRELGEAGLCGLYVLLEAPFLAVVQIIVYAGAIMVLFLFVVMVLNVPREDAAEWDRAHPLYRPMAVRVGGVLAVLLALEFAWALSRTAGLSVGVGDEKPAVSSVAKLGEVLFTKYMFAFEVTSILIIAAMVGAVVLARKREE